MLYLLYIDTSFMSKTDLNKLINDINFIEYQFLAIAGDDEPLFFTIDYIPKIKQENYKNAKFKTYNYHTDDKTICKISNLPLTPLNHKSRFKRIKKADTLQEFKEELKYYPALKDWIKENVK